MKTTFFSKIIELGIHTLMEIEYLYGKLSKKYLTFRASYNLEKGEFPKQRFPHLNLDSLEYDQENDIFRLKENSDYNQVASIFLKKDVIPYELMLPKPRKLFLKDFLGYKYSFKEKSEALKEVKKAYKENLGKDLPFDSRFNIKILNTSIFKAKKEFSQLNKYIKMVGKHPFYLVQIDSRKIFPIGITEKGTDFTITDQWDSTKLQEMIHSIYHFAEGMKGFDNDNENVIETHSNPFWIYLLQCLGGRIERRIRKGSSPHKLKFPEYVFLRAWVSNGLDIKEFMKNKPYFHGIYALLSPSTKLYYSLLEKKNRNTIMIDALFASNSKEIEIAVDKYLGQGSFDSIYSRFDTFSRLEEFLRRAKENNNLNDLYRRLFSKEELIPTLLDNRVIALVWLSKKINEKPDLVIDLIEDFYNEMLYLNKKITIDDWISHLKEKNMQEESNLVKQEKENFKDILKMIRGQSS